jgi:hypothetical protein
MIPKPKYCEQNWLDMKPANGGRMCGQCQKKIIDFSKMKWEAIETIQEANNNAVCGMYHSKQLDNWGREVPKNNFNKVAASTALILSLNCIDNFSAQSNTSNANNKSTYVSGIVKSKSKKGVIESAQFITVFLNGTQCATTTSDDGYYILNISNYIDTINELEIIFKAVGLKELRIKLDKVNSDFANINPILEENLNTLEPIIFYVKKPTLKDHIRRQWYRWFHRDE